MDLHAKPSWMSHSKIIKSNDLPPGFETNHHMNMKEKLNCIPQIKWKCPSKFVMSSNWQIAAGEESEEVVVQKLREKRVLEAFYPHSRAIPPCPVVSFGIEDDGYDDRLTPVIPIIPVEEEEASEIPPTKAQIPTKEASETTSQTKEKAASGMSHGLGLNLISAAAYAALAATMKSNDIDTQLLIKIFSDPKMVEKLIKEYGGSANITTTTASKVSEPVTGGKQATTPIPLVSVPTIGPKPFMSSKPDMVQAPNAKVGHFTDGMRPILSTAASVSSGSTLARTGNGIEVQKQVNGVQSLMGGRVCDPVKDVNYYKKLIREHGGESQESNLAFQHPKNQFQNGEYKPKKQKLCAYYNSSRGCRNGENCIFKHEMMEPQNVKRSQTGLKQN